MSTFSRRHFLGGAGALSLGGLVAACSGSPSPEGSSGGGGGGTGAGADIRWWDHFGGLQDLHARWAAEQAEKVGVGIEYTYNEPSQATEALQLANQSNQLPDIYSNVVGLPLPALVEAGWLHPIELSEEAIGRLPEGTFVEGISMLDGVIYALPALSDRQYWACTWYNSEIADEVGFEGPKSYDDLRAALRAIADDGRYAPMTLALGASGRIRDQVDDLAQAGGFPGWQGLRYDTGEYNYDHDTYINAIELLKEISDNGWLLPGTNSFQIPDARGRWAAGNVGFFIDGPWSPGGVRALNEEHLARMATSGELTPEGEELVITRGAPGGTWFVAGNSANPEAASLVVESFTQDDYQAALAEAMDQPPLNLDIVADADVIEPYAWLIDDFKQRVFRAPQVQVRNIQASEALALATPVAPTLGDIIQGYLGGDVSDLKGELVKLNDAFSSDLDSSIEQAAGAGAEVSRADWEFSDWQRGQDYTY
ncbi:ABC transporter substrate-binding protein [Occultella aeris]|uniref:Bacterial extracellular solute-binding protein n=1 Tax=Occultella aeris TaxID=2761496 RepID=A0A7M4DGX8_9MICO|nr:ABC transporter substrate-binding protein [Occultella aeris]VZO36171.1 Bacterial extracellular solute-binding protein [Occultella aeris]